MKKIFILSLVFFSTQSMATIVNDWNGVCGAYKYDNIYAVFQPNSYECAANTYLPKQKTGCVACPFGFDCDGGTFSYSETADQGIAFHVTTCQNGYFLPANSVTCMACPTGWVCNGGTFNFNRTEYQGLEKSATYMAGDENGVCAANYAHGIYAVFEINTHTCSSGYYLPAGVDGCTICPMNNICSGGTYTFNETTDQGIQNCVNGFSPTGSSVCYPHRLHVGDDVIYLRSEKQTTPSLNFKIGNDIFYANMTTTRTRMSKDSSHYFHAKTADNVHYYVCDDTTCPQ